MRYPIYAIQRLPEEKVAIALERVNRAVNLLHAMGRAEGFADRPRATKRLRRAVQSAYLREAEYQRMRALASA